VTEEGATDTRKGESKHDQQQEVGAIKREKAHSTTDTRMVILSATEGATVRHHMSASGAASATEEGATNTGKNNTIGKKTRAIVEDRRERHWKGQGKMRVRHGQGR